MRRHQLALLVVSLAAAPIGGCMAHGGVIVDESPPPEGTVYVESAPPAERAEAPPARPAGEHVWARGHWQWEGRWVWIAGRWQSHREGHRWVEGHWIRHRRGHYWVEGRWER